MLQNWFPRDIATFYFESFPHLKFTTKLWRTNNCRINQFLPHIFGGGQPNIWQLYRQIFVNERTRSGECIKQVNLFWQYAQKQKHRRCIFFTEEANLSTDSVQSLLLEDACISKNLCKAEYDKLHQKQIWSYAEFSSEKGTLKFVLNLFFMFFRTSSIILVICVQFVFNHD